MAHNTIELHTCYGNRQEVIIEGRLVEARSLKQQDENDSFLRNGWRKLKQLVNDEIKDAPINIYIQNEKFETHSDDEGYFELDINLSKPMKHLESLSIELPDRNLSLACQATILDEKIHTGIISDFDDTLVISNVTNKLKLVYNLIFENYKQREAVAGMLKRFDTIFSQNKSTYAMPFFVLTGSPKQLFKSINRFLDHHGFPSRVLITKKIHGKNANSLFHQSNYKSQKIERLLKLYPNIQWIMFGDSGEKDREIYLEIAKKYPKNVKKIYIREVESGEIKKIYPPLA